MRSLVYTGLLILLWIVNLFNGTGLDSVYHVTEWSRRIIIVLFGINILWEYQKNRALVIKKKEFYYFWLYDNDIYCLTIYSRTRTERN